jgi:O-antigen ligase
MIEPLKALIVVGVLSLAAFIYARMAFSGVVPPATINRWRNIFLVTTAIAFLVPNYWLMLAAMSGAVLLLGAAEKFRPALYLLLLFAVPAASKTVPGFGGINNFLELYPFNLLAVIILFPLLLRPGETRGAGAGALADACFIAYALVVFALAFRDTTFTDGIRRSTAFLLTAIPQYFVFSRIRWTVEKARLATAALLIPLLVLSAVAAVEVVLRWHLYANAVQNWDVVTTLRYVERSGFLRAYGSVFGPIAFGLFLVVGLALAPALTAASPRKRLAVLSMPAIGAGLLATFSRGPWVGAALVIASYVATTRRSIANLAKLSVVGLIGLAVLAVTPFGDMVISLIPFIGNVEENTIDYRQRLLEVGWTVVQQNPLFGTEGYMETPAMQTLVQGQGIIDIVNTYLRIALDSGLIGLSLYLGAVGFSVLAVLRSIGPARRVNEELSSYCQSYFAALLGISVVLATTANTIAQIQEMTWVLAGMCVGLARSVALARREQDAMRAIEQTATVVAQETEPAPLDPTPPGRTLPPHLRQYAKR